MPQKTVEQKKYDFQTWKTQIIHGTTIGLVNSTIVTPVVNYTNHTINQNTHTGSPAVKFTCARAFDGLVCYNISFILRISVALSLDSYILHKLSAYCDIKKQHTLLSSVISGGIAGATATLSESIAQTQQLSKIKPSAKIIIETAYRHNGFFGLTRGMPEMVVRSAGLTAGYLALMPPLCQYIRQEIGDHLVADIFSAMICGLLVGAITTPPNNLRWERQHDLIKKGPAPAYTQLWKEKCTTATGAHSIRAGMRHLFVGFKPQTLRCMLSMFIITKGNELCKLYSEDGFPDFPSLNLK